LDAVAADLKRKAQPGTPKFNFTINAVIIRYFLGDAWFSKHALPNSNPESFLKPDFLTDRADEVEPNYSIRMLQLAELLFNLQDVRGFAKRLDHLLLGQLEPGLAELQIGRVLRERGVPFRYVEDGEPTTVDIIFRTPDGSEALCEIKCKRETTPFSAQTLRNAISVATGQIGKGNAGIVFIKVPTAWVDVQQSDPRTRPDIRLPSAIIAAAKNELRQASRIKKLIFYVFQYAYEAEWGFSLTNTTMEFNNPKNTAFWKGDLLAAYPGGTWSELPEIAKRWA